MTELDRRKNEGDHAGVSDLLGRLMDLYLRQVLQSGVFSRPTPIPAICWSRLTTELVLLISAAPCSYQKASATATSRSWAPP
ncbi:MAG: hypothetical protein R3F38_19695 [Gammaproteobacteria bacterium]